MRLQLANRVRLFRGEEAENRDEVRFPRERVDVGDRGVVRSVPDLEREDHCRVAVSCGQPGRRNRKGSPMATPLPVLCIRK